MTTIPSGTGSVTGSSLLHEAKTTVAHSTNKEKIFFMLFYI
ncbi:hypothetical protein BACOVA_00928 [Bacteroides ovatus ATCC 8483]|uniref:Uncharacterized protein n=1 Tax=Bacteroides ovatus (strain ATCC 8483 / DSM 1896 / JCM 5824 / BCRC 10623 / CCUG 4943 / NCTC 11153) TaxID=411476 RepID=A0AAN3ABA8_BACO1|nr:hypothetical protein BACOVA_00928 [Bacteroides ovatus ATCC 8483]